MLGWLQSGSSSIPGALRYFCSLVAWPVLLSTDPAHGAGGAAAARALQ